MADFLLSEYMDRAGDIYKAAAAEIANDADKINDLKKKHSAVWGDATLTSRGKSDMSAKYADEIHALERHIEDIRREANDKARDIRGEVERDFYDYYNATPTDIDEKAVAGINSGVFTDAELLHMAGTANRTMKRIIGKRLAESGDSNTAFKGRVLQQTTLNPHIDAMNGIIGAGKMAMGGGMSGINGARGFVEKWDYVTRPIYDAAPKVGWRMDALKPGDGKHFFEDGPKRN